MATNLKREESRESVVLYMALELSNRWWKLCFSDGDKMRIKTIVAGDLEALEQEIDKSRARFRLATDCRVASVYEAGRDRRCNAIETGIGQVIQNNCGSQAKEEAHKASHRCQIAVNSV